MIFLRGVCPFDILQRRELNGILELIVTNFLFVYFPVVVQSPVHVCDVILVDFVHECNDIILSGIGLAEEGGEECA